MGKPQQAGHLQLVHAAVSRHCCEELGGIGDTRRAKRVRAPGPMYCGREPSTSECCLFPSCVCPAVMLHKVFHGMLGDVVKENFMRLLVSGQQARHLLPTIIGRQWLLEQVLQ